MIQGLRKRRIDHCKIETVEECCPIRDEEEQDEQIMTYDEAYNYIQERSKLGSILGLTTIKELLKRMGNPQDRLPVVHIAGTNGKGSILACIDAIMQDAGYRVGRYISPTIFTYLERFQINGVYMREEQYAGYMERLIPYVEAMEEDGYGPVTAFELETAIAFLHFLTEQVDLVLLETGMGGRLDATNVVTEPLCTVLASIRLDHMQILGDTIPKIAHEKCGILRDHVPCVVYPDNEEAYETIRNECQSHQAPCILPDLKELQMIKSTLNREIFAYKNVNHELALLGEHQIYNSLTAIEAVNILRGKYDLNYVNIQNGLRAVEWKGRFEILRQNPYVIRDGAHNPDAALQLRNQLIKHFTNHRILYIIGVLGDKDHDRMLKLLGPLACKAYVLTVPDNGRAMPAEALAEEVRRYIPEVVIAGSPQEAYHLALNDAGPEDVIVAFGSLYYIGKLDME